MASVFWKGEIDCGEEIQVAVHLVAAARAEKVSFSRVNPETGAGVKQQYVDASTGEVVQLKQLHKQTEVNGQMVTVTDHDLKQLADEGDKRIEVFEFVKAKEVDPVYFDSSYFVLPDSVAADYPYQLLVEAMTKAKVWALGGMSRGQRQYLVIFRPYEEGLILHTLFWANEVRNDGYKQTALVLDAEEIKLFKKFIRARSAPFNPTKYSNQYAAKLKEYLELWAEDKPDMRAALKTSIKEAKKKKRARKRKSA